ncbi:hypothetical protein [Lysobacter gummosus]|uniref:hypothetical protein n=1 Tax=Lysobacter gummosus TaxID=262324 RepID=UPI00363CD080
MTSSVLARKSSPSAQPNRDPAQPAPSLRSSPAALALTHNQPNSSLIHSLRRPPGPSR